MLSWIATLSCDSGHRCKLASKVAVHTSLLRGLGYQLARVARPAEAPLQKTWDSALSQLGAVRGRGVVLYEAGCEHGTGDGKSLRQPAGTGLWPHPSPSWCTKLESVLVSRCQVLRC